MDLEKLEQLAKAATPGPWFVHHCAGGKALDCWCGVVGESNDPQHEAMDSIIGQGAIGFKQAEYVAAANPATVLSLIAEIRDYQQELCAEQAECVRQFSVNDELRDENKRMREALEQVIKVDDRNRPYIGAVYAALSKTC